MPSKAPMGLPYIAVYYQLYNLELSLGVTPSKFAMLQIVG